MEVLPKRFGKYGLTLHPDKTRLVDVSTAGPTIEPTDDPNGPGTFDLLGFTHYWGARAPGKWVVKRRTAKDRFRRALERVARWCRAPSSRPGRDAAEALAQKLTGHFGYFGIIGEL